VALVETERCFDHCSSKDEIIVKSGQGHSEVKKPLSLDIQQFTIGKNSYAKNHA